MVFNEFLFWKGTLIPQNTTWRPRLNETHSKAVFTIRLVGLVTNLWSCNIYRVRVSQTFSQKFACSTFSNINSSIHLNPAQLMLRNNVKSLPQTNSKPKNSLLYIYMVWTYFPIYQKLLVVPFPMEWMIALNTVSLYVQCISL